MNASFAFRSHLMQQFAAQARTQSRPPLALIGLLTDENPNNGTAAPEVLDVSSWNTQEASQRFRHLSSIETSAPGSSVNLRRRHTDSEIFCWSRSHNSRSPVQPKQFTTQVSAFDHEEESSDSLLDSSVSLEGKFHLPAEFQNMLQTRRTTSRIAPLTAPMPIYEEHDYWREALERAVLCGYQAPNHKRTEPFTFKRMIAPSDRTERLAEIAYRVALRQVATEQSSLTSEQVTHKKLKAQRKKEKWSQIPAFLVATVEEESIFENDLETLNEYDQLPYMPPQSERALENYASACAAVQNVLLSLHSEDIATKWATGPVIRTPAFRELVQASENDRIVALIMVGRANGPLPKSPRRNRRPLQRGGPNDVLVDL